MRRLQGSPSPESDTQATAAQPARRTPAGPAEAGRTASAEGRGVNVVKTTTHNDVDCPARPANGLNGNAHFAKVRPPSVPGICSSWDLPVRDDSDEKPCISFMAREVQPAAKPAKARVEEKGARPSDPVSTAATGGWRTRPPGHLLRLLSRSSPLGDR